MRQRSNFARGGRRRIRGRAERRARAFRGHSLYANDREPGGSLLVKSISLDKRNDSRPADSLTRRIALSIVRLRVDARAAHHRARSRGGNQTMPVGKRKTTKKSSTGR